QVCPTGSSVYRHPHLATGGRVSHAPIHRVDGNAVYTGPKVRVRPPRTTVVLTDANCTAASDVNNVRREQPIRLPAPVRHRCEIVATAIGNLSDGIPMVITEVKILNAQEQSFMVCRIYDQGIKAKATR